MPEASGAVCLPGHSEVSLGRADISGTHFTGERRYVTWEPWEGTPPWRCHTGTDPPFPSLSARTRSRPSRPESIIQLKCFTKSSWSLPSPAGSSTKGQVLGRSFTRCPQDWLERQLSVSLCWPCTSCPLKLTRDLRKPGVCCTSSDLGEPSRSVGFADWVVGDSEF